MRRAAATAIGNSAAQHAACNAVYGAQYGSGECKGHFALAAACMQAGLSSDQPQPSRPACFDVDRSCSATAHGCSAVAHLVVVPQQLVDEVYRLGRHKVLVVRIHKLGPRLARVPADTHGACRQWQCAEQVAQPAAGARHSHTSPRSAGLHGCLRASNARTAPKARGCCSCVML